jgi:hypothetical protein
VLEQRSVALHGRHRRRKVGRKRDTRLSESVLDRASGRPRDLGWIRALERRRSAAGHVEESPDDGLDAVGLLQDDLRTSHGALVALDPPE